MKVGRRAKNRIKIRPIRHAESFELKKLKVASAAVCCAVATGNEEGRTSETDGGNSQLNHKMLHLPFDCSPLSAPLGGIN